MKRKDYEFAGQILLIPTRHIRSNPLHPRLYYDDDDFAELTQSVSRMGLIRPLSVIYDKDEGYIIVSGERRFRAAIAGGLEKVPCVVLNVSRKAAAIMALSENMQEKSLNYFEIGAYLQNLHDRFGYGYEEMTQNLAMSYAQIQYYLRFLNIPPVMRQKMIENGVTRRHATVLMRLPEDKREDFLNEIIEKKLNVNMTIERSREILKPRSEAGGKIIGYYKNTAVFINSINKAVSTMLQSGIKAECRTTESDDAIEYYIHIPKIG